MPESGGCASMPADISLLLLQRGHGGKADEGWRVFFDDNTFTTIRGELWDV